VRLDESPSAARCGSAERKSMANAPDYPPLSTPSSPRAASDAALAAAIFNSLLEPVNTKGAPA